MRRAMHAAALVVVFLFSCRAGLAQGSGADTFKAKCELCHGPDGLGSTPMGKALGIVSYKSPAVLKMSDTDLAAAIKNGKNNKMPAFGGQLSDAQIRDVLKYVHTLQK